MARVLGLILGAGLAAVATAACASELPLEVIDRLLKICKYDVQRVCPSAVPGDRRVGRCLLDHEHELGADCQKEVKFAYTLEVCLPDVRQFCANAPQRQSLECLGRMMGSVSAECRWAMTGSSPRTAEREVQYGGDRYDYEPPRAPYAPPGEDRYAYREPPARRDDPYSPPPRPYAAPPEENDGYDAPQGPRERRYGYDAPYAPYARRDWDPEAYRGPREDEERGDGDRYGDEDARRDGDDGRRFGDDRPRFQPYGMPPYPGEDRYADRGYFDAPPRPYDGRGPW